MDDIEYFYFRDMLEWIECDSRLVGITYKFVQSTETDCKVIISQKKTLRNYHLFSFQVNEELYCQLISAEKIEVDDDYYINFLLDFYNEMLK